jgi:hypothetical protein
VTIFLEKRRQSGFNPPMLRSKIQRSHVAGARTRVLLTVALLARVCLSAAAPRLFNSGTDTNGAVLPEREVDPRITIVDRTDGLTGTNAYVVPANGFWLPNNSTSAWLSADPDPSAAINAQWTYRVPFDLGGADPATTTIEARISSDNEILWTQLNGVDLGFTNGQADFDKWTTLTLTNGLTAGVNHLDFRLNDFGVVSGFRIEFTGSITPPLEPFRLTIDVTDGIVLTGSIGAGYRIEVTDDLGATNWAPLTEGVISQRRTPISDPDFLQRAQHFYRAVLQ